MNRSTSKKSHSPTTLETVTISPKPRVRASKASSAVRAPRKRGGDIHALAINAPGQDDPHWTDVLLDGTHVLIRPIQKTDIELERAFIKFLSPEARRMRFLGQMSEPSDELLRCLTDIDYQRDMAFIALVHRDGETQEVGVSRYGTSIDGKSCECAVTVSDAWRHRGLATLLMRHLIEYARAHGIRKMVSFDASENAEMRELAKYLGFERKVDPQDAQMVIHSLTL